jgi:hypothetical protein
MFPLSSLQRNYCTVWCINDISSRKLDWQLWYVSLSPLVCHILHSILSRFLESVLDQSGGREAKKEDKKVDKKGTKMNRRRTLTCRWRNTTKVTSEHAPEYSVTQHTSYRVEEPIYLVWILLNCIVLIVEIFILRLVVNMLLSMVSLFSSISFACDFPLPPCYRPRFRLSNARCHWDVPLVTMLFHLSRFARRLTYRRLLRNHLRPAILPNIPRTPLCTLQPNPPKRHPTPILFPTHLPITLANANRR